MTQKSSLTCDASPYRRFTRGQLIDFLKRNGLGLQEVRKNVGTAEESKEYYIEDAAGKRVGNILARANRYSKVDWNRAWWDAHRKVENSW